MKVRKAVMGKPGEGKPITHMSLGVGAKQRGLEPGTSILVDGTTIYRRVTRKLAGFRPPASGRAFMPLSTIKQGHLIWFIQRISFLPIEDIRPFLNQAI